MLLAAFERRALPCTVVDVRSALLPIDETAAPFEIALNRCISQTLGLSAVRYFEAKGVAVVNSSQVIETCGDKSRMSLAFNRAAVPIPRTIVALSAAAALRAIENIGYPVVLKPVIGSWGRMVAKLNDRDAAEAALAYKEELPNTQHGIYYLQEFVRKPDRDVRVIVMGEEVVAAYYRCSTHWITNVKRGAVGAPCRITPTLWDIAVRAANAVGRGVLSVDLFEVQPDQLLVNEVNHTTEFAEAARVTSVDIAGRYVDYLTGVSR